MIIMLLIIASLIISVGLTVAVAELEARETELLGYSEQQ